MLFFPKTLSVPQSGGVSCCLPFVVPKAHRRAGSEQWVSVSAGSPEPEDEALFGFGGTWGLTCHQALCFLGASGCPGLPQRRPLSDNESQCFMPRGGQSCWCSSNGSSCCVVEGPEALLVFWLSIQYPTKQIHQCPSPSCSPVPLP